MPTPTSRRPHSPGVYLRRRLMVLLGLVAVVVIIVLIVSRPGTKAGASPGGDAPAASPVASGEPSAAHTPEASDGDPCVAEQVVVKAITDATDYIDGEKPKLSLSVTNTGTNSCLLNAGTSQQVYTITSGSDVYWRSTDCQTGATDHDVLLEAGQTMTSEAITWDRTRSAKDTCEQKHRPNAPAGGASYKLTTEVAGIKSESAKQFLLN